MNRRQAPSCVLHRTHVAGTVRKLVQQNVYNVVFYISFQGDLSQLSPAMKSVVQPPSNPNTSQTTTEVITTAPRPNNTPTLNDTRGGYPPASAPEISPTYPPTYTSAPENTFLTPGPSMQAYHPQYSLPPGMSSPWRYAYPQQQSGDFRGSSPNASVTSLAGPFAPKTAAELGLLDRPDTSYEGLELSNCVDRITAAFPLDVQSGISYFLKRFSPKSPKKETL